MYICTYLHIIISYFILTKKHREYETGVKKLKIVNIGFEQKSKHNQRLRRTAPRHAQPPLKLGTFLWQLHYEV